MLLRSLLSLFLICGIVLGQDPISGKVSAAGKAIPGATVTARSGGKPFVTVTEEDGQFSLTGVPPGPVVIEVEMFGFARLRQEVAAAERSAPLALALTLIPPRRVNTGQRSNELAAPVEGLAISEAAVETQPTAPVDPGQASEAYLIQGSLSQGLDSRRREPESETVTAGTTASAPVTQGAGNRVAAARGGRRSTGTQAFGNRRAANGRNAMQASVFMTLRNSALDAAPYSVTGQTLAKPSYAQSRFGGTLGGPLRIPKLLERGTTFFFLNYQGTRSRNPYSNFAILPTEAERTGDFSQTRRLLGLFDAGTGLPFPDKKIPASRVDKASAGLLPFVPLPNLNATPQNYQLVTSVPNNSDNLNVRVNQALSGKDRIAIGGAWQRRDGEALQLFGYRDASSGSGVNLDLTWTHNFSARLLHNARFRYNLNRTEGLPYFAYGPDVSGQLGIQGNSRDPINYGPPNLNFTNYGDLTDGNHLLRRIHGWTYGYGITNVRGKHTLTSGFEFQRNQWNTITEQNARGTLFFGGLVTSGFDSAGLPLRNTGWDFADFLLGRPQQSNIRFDGADTYMRGSQYSAYAQDDWRMSSSLSLSLGLRYEYFSPYTEKYGRMSNLDIAPFFTDAAVVVPGKPGPFTGPFPSGLIDGDRNNFSPRLGVAWKPFGSRHIVRAGYGIYYDGTVYGRIPSRLAAQPPFAQASTFQISVDNPLTMTQPFTGPADVNIKNTYAVDRHYLSPYAQTWNASIQYNLSNGMFVEAGYLGTKGTRLVLQRLPNRAPAGSPANSEDRRPIGNAVGFTYDSTEGNSILHAGQLRFVKRMRRGVSMNAFYSYSKSIDNASSIGGGGAVVVQNDQDFAAERGLSVFDKRHQLNLNAVLSSPFGPRGFFLQNRGVWATLLRDWSVMAGVNAATGTPLTARVSGNVADSAGTGATGSSRAQATGLPIDAGEGYFNLLAFTTPKAGTYGNAGRNTIPGPGLFSLDVSLGRSFQIGDNARRRLELRMESSNVLNHVNITSYGTVVNSANYGLASRAGDMRGVTLTLRYRF